MAYRSAHQRRAHLVPRVDVQKKQILIHSLDQQILLTHDELLLLLECCPNQDQI